MAEDAWRPGARREALLERAALYRYIREFFAARQVLEVCVPVLGRSTTLDPNIASLGWQDDAGSKWYLQSSPEHFMKRLLAADSGDIYYLGAALRAGEQGDIHNLEFTLLEWYRCDYDHHRLMAEVTSLLDGYLGEAPVTTPVTTISYGELLSRIWEHDVLGLEPAAQLELAVRLLDGMEAMVAAPTSLTPGGALDALYAEALARAPWPRFFVTDFPPEQAAMAKLAADEQGRPVAARFECIVNGVELANGYFELQDASEQRSRWRQEAKIRKQSERPAVAPDEKLLAALAAGLPECAGVALGVDRLLMLKLGIARIDDVLSFGTKRL